MSAEAERAAPAPEAPAVRLPRDGYFTPEPLALALLTRVEALAVFPYRSDILEPSSGGGAFVRAARAVWPRSTITAIDISPTAAMFATGAEFRRGDFLHHELWNGYDLICGNPPFSDAEAHVRHALGLVREGGWVAMLLRLAFVASQGRMRGICSGPGRYVAPIAPRPSFTGTGNDNSEYALFCWQRGSTNPSVLGEPIFWERAP